MARPDQTTHFGFRDVPLGEKQTLVNDVFHSVAQRYDLMNDLMSVGLHRAWKDIMITTLNPPKNDAPFALLDVAGGTGDVAFRAAKASGLGFRATVCDINVDMLEVGRNRAAAQHLDDRVFFVEGNAEARVSAIVRRKSTFLRFARPHTVSTSGESSGLPVGMVTPRDCKKRTTPSARGRPST